MVRLNPKYEEFFYEDIINYFFFCREYIENENIDFKILKRQIFKYITRKKGFNSCFKISKELLQSVKQNLVVPLYNNIFSVFGLSVLQKDEILSGAIKLIIYDSFGFGYRDIEISSDKYFLERYPEIVELLLRIRTGYFDIFEIYFRNVIGNLWDSFYVIWSKFRENIITYGEFLDEVYKILDEKEFIKGVHKISLGLVN